MFLIFFIIFKFFFKILNTLIEVEQIKKDPCPYYKNNNHYYINSIVLKKLVKCFHNYPLVYILLILSLYISDLYPIFHIQKYSIVNAIKDKKKMSCILPFILKLTMGPALLSSAEPGCNPFIIRGIIKMKKGTVKNAIME